jgi:hypothetical protein
VTLTLFNEHYKEQSEVRDAKTYSQTVYDTVTEDWVPSNENLDFDTPHRQDYTLYIPSTGDLYMDAQEGLLMDIWTEHALPVQRHFLRDRQVGLKIVNTQGKFSLRSVVFAARYRRFAMRQR